jgi:predicted alpha/beta superfamily hydrolase
VSYTLHMRTFVFTLILSLLFLLSCTKKKDDVSPRLFTMKADYGTNYKITVHLPEHADSARLSQSPVILYLDAEWMRDQLTKAISQKQLNGNTVRIGIGYADENRRMEDYSMSETSYNGTGNAGHFTRFISEQLLPKLRKDYHIHPDSSAYTFCGHSMGGLFGTYILLSRPGLFRNYILISSSLMFDSQAIFRLEQEKRGQASLATASVFLGMGTSEEMGMQTTKKHFVKLLRTHYPSIRLKEKDYRNKDHTGVIAPALLDALDFIYH